MIKPKKLKEGDLILIVAPAGYVRKEDLEPTLNLIEKNGWKFEFGKNTFKEYTFGYRYSGTVEERFTDLQWALDHPDAKAIWFARGGYGGVQIIDFLNLKNFKKNPKWLIGYSDNTVFHQHFNKRKIATLHATVCKLLPQGQSEETFSSIVSVLKGENISYKIQSHPFNQKGKVQAKLSGGNLSILYSLLGSKSLDNFKDKILFIEDWYENFYHIDRMLIGMERAGAFKNLKGLIVGGMTKMDVKNENAEYENPFDLEAYKVISERFKNYDFPKVFGFPSGHIFDTRAMIMHAEVSLTVEDSVIFENYVF